MFVSVIVGTLACNAVMRKKDAWKGMLIVRSSAVKMADCCVHLM